MGCDILIGTPGRLFDFIQWKQIDVKHVSYLVLDEADEMLNMGFEPQIRQIVQFLPKTPETGRQTVLFSATWPNTGKIREVARDFLHDPALCQAKMTINTNITQEIQVCGSGEKFDALSQILLEHLDTLEDQAMIFCERKRDCWDLAKRLRGYFVGREDAVEDFHGERKQHERMAALEGFKDGRVQLLICTDAAARGINVPGLKLVIQFDYAHHLAAYCHRIG